MESMQRGEMLNEINQYAELLELRAKQMEEEYAAQQQQMVRTQAAQGSRSLDASSLRSPIPAPRAVAHARGKGSTPPPPYLSGLSFSPARDIM